MCRIHAYNPIEATQINRTDKANQIRYHDQTKLGLFFFRSSNFTFYFSLFRASPPLPSPLLCIYLLQPPSLLSDYRFSIVLHDTHRKMKIQPIQRIQLCNSILFLTSPRSGVTILCVMLPQPRFNGKKTLEYAYST